MITLIKRGASYNSLISEIYGLSSEIKPVTEIEDRFIENGSVYTEIDTGKKFMYDKENEKWYEIRNSGGGGGDSSEYAHSLELTMNSQTYVMTATLKNTSGEVLGTPQTIDLPLETMVVGGSYDDTTKKVILTLKNGNTVDFSVADLVDGLQPEITSTNKLNSDLVDDTNQNNKFVTSAEKTKIANALTEEVYNAGKTTPYGTQYVIAGKTYTVGRNAEIFNSYANNKAIGEYSHAEGDRTTATGSASHAEGGALLASGISSHAEGGGTTASGNYSHAEGNNTKASGLIAHAEGEFTNANGRNAHTEGASTTANGECSHAEGGGTIAASDYQHVQGKYNVEDSSDKYAFIIGNGTSTSARSNAFAVDWNGLIYVNNASTGVNVSQLQPAINSSNKIDADFVDDSNSSNKFVTSDEKTKISNNNRALVELIDSGQKNLASVNSGTFTAPTTPNGARYISIPVTGVSGDVVLYTGNLESDDTTVTTCGLRLQFVDGTTQTIQINRGNNIVTNISLSGELDEIGIYPANGYTASAGKSLSFQNLMLCSKTAWDISQKYVPYRPLNSDLVDDTDPNVNKFVTSAEKTQIATNTHNIAIIKSMLATTFGFKINKNDMNPNTRVEYLYDAVGMNPAYMDFTNDVFSYGDWGDAWFVKDNRPVALKYDGTVDYELDHSDFTKKLNGTASDITNTSYGGNFMSEIPLCYIKRWEDKNYNYIAISNNPVDDSYKAYAHTNANSIIKPQIYLPMFKGSVVDNKLRSIAGQFPTGNTTGSQEVSYAEACGSGWQLWDWSKHELIADLLTLISRSTDSKGKFGKGDINSYRNVSPDYGKQPTGGYCSTVGNLSTFAVDSNGQFYGKNDDTHHVTAFYIEDFWGNRYDKCLGLNLDSGVYKVKMIPPYTIDTDSTYTTVQSISVPSSNWLKNISTGDYGGLPSQTGATETTGYCNYFYSNTSSVRSALFGGNCNFGSTCGYRCVHLNSDSSVSNWSTGGSPCFNPL